MNVSKNFFLEIDNVAKSPIPAVVMQRARQSLLDYLAVTCAGAAFQREKIEKYFAFAQPEEGAFKVIGTGRSLVLKEETPIDNSNSKTNVYDVEDSKEETSNSNTYVYDLEKEESDSLALEDEDTIDIDVEAKLEKLKSLYEKGLIREEEYKSSVNEILSNI